MYLLAGSHNFLLMESINQSLAGRTAIVRLLPFSHLEMKEGNILPPTVNEEIFKGAYPRLYDKDIAPTDYYPFYIQTYVERDVRLIRNIGDLSKFIRFLKLCAGRIGQLLNISSLANECGVSVTTATSWISILEASYICYLLKPDHNNYAKRLVKAPKRNYILYCTSDCAHPFGHKKTSKSVNFGRFRVHTRVQVLYFLDYQGFLRRDRVLNPNAQPPINQSFIFQYFK